MTLHILSAAPEVVNKKICKISRIFRCCSLGQNVAIALTRLRCLSPPTPARICCRCWKPSTGSQFHTVQRQEADQWRIGLYSFRRERCQRRPLTGLRSPSDCRCGAAGDGPGHPVRPTGSVDHWRRRGIRLVEQWGRQRHPATRQCRHDRDPRQLGNRDILLCRQHHGCPNRHHRGGCLRPNRGHRHGQRRRHFFHQHRLR